jgi:hypothetical protein
VGSPRCGNRGGARTGDSGGVASGERPAMFRGDAKLVSRVEVDWVEAGVSGMMRG